MLSNSEFIQSRLHDLEGYNELHDQGLKTPSTDAKVLDPITKLIGLHQSYAQRIKKARIGIFNTLTTAENEDGTISFRPFDLQAYRSFQKATDDYSRRLLAVESTLEQLEKIEGIGYMADLQRTRDAGKSKVNSLEQKLSQLKNSTRHDEADMKAAQKEVKQQLSVARVELAQHQKVLDQVDAILAEIDVQK